MARRILVAAATVLAAVTASCSSGGDASPSTSSTAALSTQSTVTVTSSTTTLTRPPIDTTSTTTTLRSPPHLEVLDPVHGATVTTRQYTFTGITDPGCTVTVGGRHDAAVQPDGAWALELVLNPGGNTTTFTATDPASGLQATAMFRVQYEPSLTLLGDGLGDLEFSAPEDDAVAYLVSVLGTPDTDRQQQPETCYERVLTWTSVGLEAWITDHGGHRPSGGSYGCGGPRVLSNWRVFDAQQRIRLQTPEGIGAGSSAQDMCRAYGHPCTGRSMHVLLHPDFFPYDQSLVGIAFEFDRTAEDPSARIAAMSVTHGHGGSYSGNPWPRTVDHAAETARLRFRAVLFGRWEGAVTTPWTQPYAITLDLDLGRYGAANHDTVAPAALFFGTDEECGDSCWTHRRWEVREVVDSVGVGWMAILLESGPDDVWAEAKLDNIRLSEDGTYLEFDLWRPYELDGELGPIHFTGTRSDN